MKTFVLALIGLALAAAPLGGAAATGGPAFHGIGFAQACAGPLHVGDPVSCSARIANTVDEAGDTVRVTSLSDRVETALGTSASGEILPSVRLVFRGPVSCEGGHGTGTPDDPYVGATACLVPAGSTIETQAFAHSTVGPLDAGRVRTAASLVWDETCTGCATSPHVAEATASAVVGSGPARPGDFHGIGFTEGCASPVAVGDPHVCSVHIRNVIDSGHDTLRVTGLADTVMAADGAAATGELLPSAALVFDGAVACTGGSGAGTEKRPYVGATGCALASGASIAATFAHYTVQPADLALPGGLTALATLEWSNTCVAGTGSCTTEAQLARADAQAQLSAPHAGPHRRGHGR